MGILAASVESLELLCPGGRELGKAAGSWDVAPSDWVLIIKINPYATGGQGSAKQSKQLQERCS